MPYTKRFGLQTKVALLQVVGIISVATLLNACSTSISKPVPLTDNSASATPQAPQTKEILIVYGHYDKPYTKLGTIEYTLTDASTPNEETDQYELWDQAIEHLKQRALDKYGDKVEALTNVEIVESTAENSGSQSKHIHAKGIAISFAPGTRPIIRHKAQNKAKPPPKPTAIKAKPPKKTADKPQTDEEIEITPSELLK
jgi:hypothetical protein